MTAAEAGSKGNDAASGAGPKLTPAKRCITFEGGGFLAQADYAGVVAGLLHVLPSVKSSPKDGVGLSYLFEKFGIIVGVSGGSWFASQILYSKSFDGLLYASAAKPEKTEAIWNSQYYTKVLNPLVNTTVNGTVKGIKECLWKALPMVTLQESASTGTEGASGAELPSVPLESQYDPWYRQMLAEAIILVQAGGITWEDLVVNLLQRGSGIDPSMTLGSPATPRWAKNKLYIQGVTTATPSADAAPYNADESFTEVRLVDREKQPVLSYNASAAPPPPADAPQRAVWMPAKYSVIVGAGEQQESPLPFCATKDCFGLALDYQYRSKNTSTMTKVSLGSLYGESFEKSAGRLPVGSTSAVSSAFEGKDAITQAWGAEQGCVELAVWASTGVGNGEAFTAARALRDKLFSPFPVGPKLASKAVKQGLQPLIDGGFTDLTGIGHAVAARPGAREVMAFLNVGRGSAGWEGFLDAFQCAQCTVADPQKVYFKKPLQEEVWQLLSTDRFTTIPANPGASFLQNITFGSFEAVTADNKWFGVVGGHKVKIDLIAVATDNLTIGLIEEGFSYNSFFNYGTVSREIVEAMTTQEHVHKTQRLLREFFL